MGLPKEIAELIERFKRNREAYKSGLYNDVASQPEFEWIVSLRISQEDNDVLRRQS